MVEHSWVRPPPRVLRVVQPASDDREDALPAHEELFASGAAGGGGSDDASVGVGGDSAADDGGLRQAQGREPGDVLQMTHEALADHLNERFTRSAQLHDRSSVDGLLRRSVQLHRHILEVRAQLDHHVKEIGFLNERLAEHEEERDQMMEDANRLHEASGV